MIRKLLVPGCGALLLAACGHALVMPQRAAPSAAPRSSEFVEAIRDYAKPRDVPAAFQHLVDWHAGSGHVVLLIGVGGRRACAVSPEEATRVIAGQRYRCSWRGAW